jgi:hypothetical protein
MMRRRTSRRSFNALLLSAGAACALPRALQGESVLAGDASLASGRNAFLHPGMLHSRADLKRMRDGVRRRTQPIFAGFEMLRNHPLSQATCTSAGAFAEIGRNPTVHSQEFDRDCNAAYQCAVMSSITGDAALAKVSVGILDAWSRTLRTISGADAVLCATLGGFKLVNAAELMRHTDTGWAGEDAERFGTILREVFLPVIDNFAPYANGNWDTAAMKMMMAIAIYGDDRLLFERALDYYRFGCGDGRLAHYIYANGQCQESGRDQQHSQLGLAHLGDCCEMAWHQGLDLYCSLENRLLLGFEYTARYNLGEQVPFEPDIDQTGKYRHNVISPRSALRPVYEQIYHHYVHRRGLTAPWTERAAEKIRPEGAAFGADHTGFGTLIYSREAGPDTAEAAAVAVPTGLHTAANDAAIELDFVPLARATRYTISRANVGSPAYKRIAQNIAGTIFRDRTVQPSRLYSYRVSAAGSHQASLPTTVMAGLPAGWELLAIGIPGDLCSASFHGAIYRLRAAGTPPPGPAFTAAVIHRAMPARSTFTARILPGIGSQLLTLGIAVLNETATAIQAILSLSPRGQLERPDWSVSLLRADQGGIPMRMIAAQSVSAPTITYGRLVLPLWFRLDRAETALRATISDDGHTWQDVGATTLPQGSMHAGLFLNSGLDKLVTEIFFDQVSLTGVA